MVRDYLKMTKNQKMTHNKLLNLLLHNRTNFKNNNPKKQIKNKLRCIKLNIYYFITRKKNYLNFITK